MSEPDTDPNVWMENLNPAKVQIWREAMAHLRHLSDDVLNGMKFFLTMNGFVIILFITFMVLHSALVLFLIAALGLSLTMVARYILKRNRVYYLQMLMKKTLLEKELGFYDVKFSGTQVDLVLPWRLTPETVTVIKEDPEKWVTAQIRSPGTIARWLFLIYEVLMGVYVLLLISVVISWISGSR
ncbi:MAG: hypothetical protein JWQ71_4910 [Pedosphaera sp.]|nr:hypothetical protein [Pedosphaera sp.]